MSPRPAGSLDIEGAIRDTLGVLRRNLLPLALMSLIVVGLPSLLLRGALLDSDVLEPGLWTSFGLSGAILTVAQALLQAITVRIIWRDLAGRPPLPIGAAVSEAVANAGNLLVLALLVGLARGIWYVLMIPGFLAFVLPGLALLALGIWVGVLWSLAVPVVVVEGSGAIAALNRSTVLTHGDRWQLLGLMILMMALAMVAGTLLEAVLGAPGEAIGQAGAAAVASVALVVVYFQMRQAKEGQSVGQLAETARLL